MAAANAADARSASIARGLGLEYEKVSLDRQLAYADINKTAATWRGLTSAAFGLAEASIHAKRSKFWEGDPSKVLKEYVKKGPGRGPASTGGGNPYEGVNVDAIPGYVKKTASVRRGYRKYRIS